MAVKSIKDVRNSLKLARRAILIGVESVYALGKDISKIKDFYNHEVKHMAVTH